MTELDDPRARQSTGSTSSAYILRSAAVVSSVRMVSLVLTLGASIILARSLSLDDRGTYAVASSVPAIAALCWTAGLEVAVLRAAGAGMTAAALHAALRRFMSSCVVCVTAILVIAVLPEVTIGQTDAGSIRLALAVTPFIIGSQLFGNTLLARGDTGVWARISLANPFLYAAGAAGIGIFGTVSVDAYLLCLLTAYVATSSMFLAAIWGGAERASSLDLRAIRRTSRAAAPVTLAQLAMLRTQVPLLQALSAASAVALLSVAAPIVEVLLLLPVAVGTALLPIYSRQGSSSRSAMAHALHTWLITGVGAIILCASSPFLIPALFGAGYGQAALLVTIMAPGVVVFAGARVVQSYLIAQGRPRPVIVSGAAGLITSVLLQLLLSPSHGSVGAAVAIGSGYVVASVPILYAGALETRGKGVTQPPDAPPPTPLTSPLRKVGARWLSLGTFFRSAGRARVAAGS